MIRMIELFAGIGAQASAMERLGIPHERVAVSEIDERAYRAYCAIHGPTPNLGDITAIDHLPDCDLVTYSSPCQDISIAGGRAGLAEGSGTRSSLLWEVGRLLADAKEREREPEVLLMENVESILFKHARPDFDRWVDFLETLGYDSSYQVINSKDHGVPQNRKRLFMISTLSKGHFVFPETRPLERCLADVLEDDVPESYYLSEERIATFQRAKMRNQSKGNGFGWKLMTPEGISNTVLTKPDKSNGLCLILSGTLESNYEMTSRVYSPRGLCPVITCGRGGGHIPKILEGWDE